jgi:hypothetical protein
LDTIGPGNEHDSRRLQELVDGLSGRPREFYADAAYDTENIRRGLESMGVEPNIPVNQGMLKEFTFDPDNKEIIPPVLQAQTDTERPTVSSMSTIADELLKRAKLKELEKLKMSGKINEEAYRELRKEVEET